MIYSLSVVCLFTVLLVRESFHVQAFHSLSTSRSASTTLMVKRLIMTRQQTRLSFRINSKDRREDRDCYTLLATGFDASDSGDDKDNNDDDDDDVNVEKVEDKEENKISNNIDDDDDDDPDPVVNKDDLPMFTLSYNPDQVNMPLPGFTSAIVFFVSTAFTIYLYYVGLTSGGPPIL